jgi:hypothetical protein
MKKKVRTLEFYGYDNDSTMLRYDNYFPVSDVKEIENMKYIIPDEEDGESEDESGSTEDNG